MDLPEGWKNTVFPLATSRLGVISAQLLTPCCLFWLVCLFLGSFCLSSCSHSHWDIACSLPTVWHHTESKIEYIVVFYICLL